MSYIIVAAFILGAGVAGIALGDRPDTTTGFIIGAWLALTVHWIFVSKFLPALSSILQDDSQ